MKRYILWILAGFLLAGCSSSRKVQKSIPTLEQPVAVTSAQTDRLLREARKWVGTPYRYGGETRSGVDCSGFVMVLFRDVCGLKLPRNSAQQQEYARPIRERELQPGDLVFFASGSRVNHVGLYVGNRRMIHASPSRGVIEAALDDNYFQRTFHSAGRVIAPNPEQRKRIEKQEQNRQKELQEKLKRLEEERASLQQRIDQESDSIYVTNQAIFD